MDKTKDTIDKSVTKSTKDVDVFNISVSRKVGTYDKVSVHVYVNPILAKLLVKPVQDVSTHTQRYELPKWLKSSKDDDSFTGVVADGLEWSLNITNVFSYDNVLLLTTCGASEAGGVTLTISYPYRASVIKSWIKRQREILIDLWSEYVSTRRFTCTLKTTETCFLQTPLQEVSNV